MSDFLTKQRVLLALEEDGYASGSVPVPANNAIAAEEVSYSYPGEVLERNLQNDSLSPDSPLIGKRYTEITFSCELKGSGTAGTAPAIGDLLEACGFSESIDAGLSVVYAPDSTEMKSVRIYMYDYNSGGGNAKLHDIQGARGSFELVLEAGQRPMINFTFQGLYEIPEDVANPSPVYGETTKPPVVESASFEINSETTLVVQALNIDMANELVQSEGINASTGVSKIVIVGRKPNGSFNPEVVTIATEDFFTDWVGATQRDLSVALGSVAGNICTITAPKVTYDTINDGDRNGIRINEIPFHLGKDSGNDELVLTFT